MMTAKFTGFRVSNNIYIAVIFTSEPFICITLTFDHMRYIPMQVTVY